MHYTLQSKSAFELMNSVMFMASALWINRYHNYPHSVDKETEAQSHIFIPRNQHTEEGHFASSSKPYSGVPLTGPVPLHTDTLWPGCPAAWDYTTFQGTMPPLHGTAQEAKYWLHYFLVRLSWIPVLGTVCNRHLKKQLGKLN